MMRPFALIIRAALMGAVLALVAGLVYAVHAAAVTRPAPGCTQLDGMCLVVGVTFAGNGRQAPRLFTCELTKLPASEGHGVSFGAYTCYPVDKAVPFP